MGRGAKSLISQVQGTLPLQAPLGYGPDCRCAMVGCKGRLTTNLLYRQQQQPPVSSGVHMHPPNPVEVAIRRVQNTVKTAAVTTRDPPRSIVQAAIANVNEEIATAVGSSTNLRQTIRRKRKATDNNPPCTWYWWRNVDTRPSKGFWLKC